MAFEPIGVVAARVVRDAQAQSREIVAVLIVIDWLMAAEDGLTLDAAAKRLGRDRDEGRKVAAKHGFRFTRDTRRLPDMTGEQRRDYRRMQRKGVSRADALAALGLEERLW